MFDMSARNEMAFNEGWDAYNDGASATANPYVSGSLFEAWDLGFVCAQRAMELELA
jgi:hypothetical protein